AGEGRGSPEFHAGAARFAHHQFRPRRPPLRRDRIFLQRVRRIGFAAHDDPGARCIGNAEAIRARTAQRIGFDWDPRTGRMWAGETGQDNLGDAFPPDEINLIEAGKHYGFPFFIAKNQPNTGQAELQDATPDVTSTDAVPPALELPPHISPIDMRFY